MGNIKNNKIVFWGLMYWAALIVSYLWSMQNHWSKEFPSDLNFYKLIITLLTIVVMLKLVPDEYSVLSLFIVVLLFIVIFPLGVMYACQDKESLYYLSVFICFITVEILVNKMKFSKISFCNETNLLKIVTIVSLLIVVLSMFVLSQERGLPDLSSMDFSITYEIRSSYVISGLASRMFEFSTKAIIPFLIAISFLKKKYGRVIILLVIQFFFFLWLANKTTVFSIGIMIAGYLIAKSKRPPVFFAKVLCIGLVTLSIAEGINNQGINEKISYYILFSYSLLVRRLIFVPAHLKFSYFDFFVLGGNPRVGFFGTFIAPVLTRLGVDNPYESVSYSQVIGRIYLNNSDANTGIFGAELAHFGYFGLAVAMVLLVVLLLCIKRSEYVNGKIFTCCVAVYGIISLSDTAILRMIDYSPLFLISVILFLYKMNNSELGYKINIRKRKKRCKLVLF